MKRKVLLMVMAGALLLSCFGCKTATKEESATTDTVVQGDGNDTTGTSDLPQKVDQQDRPSGGNDSGQPSGGSGNSGSGDGSSSGDSSSGGSNDDQSSSGNGGSGDSSGSGDQSGDADDDTTETTEGNLKLMTYNIRYTDDPNGHSIDERAPRVKQIIEKHDPDVIGMMEVTVPWAEHLEADYADQYGVVVHYRSATNPEGLAILYKKDTVSMLNEGFFWLSETPDQESLSYDTTLPRICTWMQLKHKATGQIFVYYNLHLGGSEKANTGSYQQVAQDMEKYSQYPCFAGGDLNMLPQHSYNHFINNMDEARTTVSEGNDFLLPTYATGYPAVILPVTGSFPIDYIFHQETKAEAVSYEVDQSTIDGKWPSDHFPVICTYNI